MNAFAEEEARVEVHDHACPRVKSEKINKSQGEMIQCNGSSSSHCTSNFTPFTNLTYQS